MVTKLLIALVVLGDVARGERINSETLTVSGVSAGGAMAMQVQFAYSKIVKSVGIIAGIPYMCAAGTLETALLCMNESWLINVDGLLSLAATAAALGNIDPLENLVTQSAFLLSGTEDTVVKHETMIKLADMMTKASVSNVTTVFDLPAEHAWITNNSATNECNYLGSPYINDCGFDFAEAMLHQAFEHLGLDFNNVPNAQYNTSNLISFDQRKHGAIPTLNSLAANGYLYLPTNCSIDIDGATHHSDVAGKAECHVHLNFHGCKQSTYWLNDTYIQLTGINQWAESNNIIVVYPQTCNAIDLINPNGCFDWWGYSSELYALKSGPQMLFVLSIITSLFELNSI